MNERKLAGALVGLAVGDAVGTTLEFRPHSAAGYGLTDMVGGGPFNLPVGAWTDDTSMALCLADSLLAKGGLVARDLLERFVRWQKRGENSAVGYCFDIGGTVSGALARFTATGKTQMPENPQGAGNGSLMRVAPVALFAWRDPAAALTIAYAQSYTTHGAEDAALACELWTVGLLAAAQDGATKESVIAAMEAEALNLSDASKLRSILRDRTYATKTAAQIRGSGYVVEAFEAALWAWYTTDSFDAAVLKAANLGQDADTTAAIVGQLAGAFYGLDGIRQDWRDKLVWGELIEELAFNLIAALTPNAG